MIRKHLIILAAAILTLSFFLSQRPVFAIEKEAVAIKIEKESVNPGDDYRYVIKRLEEKIILLLSSFSPSRKADYYEKLVNVRLAELKYVVDKKDIANIQTTSQRYAAASGELTDFVLKNNLTNYNEKVVSLLSSHIPFLEQLRDTYPYISSEYRFVQDDINSLKSLIFRLST